MGGEEYSILTPPSESSTLVKDECLRMMTTDIGPVSLWMQIAIYTTVDFHEINLKIRDLGTDLTDLYGMSVLTLNNFRAAIHNVLQKLKATFQYLLDGSDEDKVLDNHANISSGLAVVAGKAEMLHTKYTEHEEIIYDCYGGSDRY